MHVRLHYSLSDPLVPTTLSLAVRLTAFPCKNTYCTILHCSCACSAVLGPSVGLQTWRRPCKLSLLPCMHPHPRGRYRQISWYLQTQPSCPGRRCGGQPAFYVTYLPGSWRWSQAYPCLPTGADHWMSSLPNCPVPARCHRMKSVSSVHLLPPGSWIITTPPKWMGLKKKKGAVDSFGAVPSTFPVPVSLYQALPAYPNALPQFRSAPVPSCVTGGSARSFPVTSFIPAPEAAYAMPVVPCSSRCTTT